MTSDFEFGNTVTAAAVPCSLVVPAAIIAIRISAIIGIGSSKAGT